MNNKTSLKQYPQDCKDPESCIQMKPKEIVFDKTTYQWADLEMTSSVVDLIERDSDTRWCIQLINAFHKQPEFNPCQGQLWTMKLNEQRLRCTILVEPNNDIENACGTRSGINLRYDPRPRARISQYAKQLCGIQFIVYQNKLCIEHELPKKHPLRKFVHLQIGN